MAPTHSRQLLIWTIPTIAVIFSYFWYRRKRIGPKTDPGDTSSTDTASETAAKPTASAPSTNRTFSRSLSGVDSAPIDIIIPPKLKAAKSNPVVISDEDLDLEIEKIKSMRYGGSIDLRKSNSSSESTKKEASVKKSPIMAQKVPEEKCGVSLPKESVKVEEKSPVSIDIQRQNSDRDSANHSPADVMLASPSLSSISDNHSEGSNDSGKGGSDVVTPPPSRSLGTDGATSVTVYEFIIPQSLVGKLIGKHGSSVANIKDKTGAHVIVRKHPNNNKLKVCSVEGSQKEIDSALKLIRDKFPLKRFPEVTLEQVSFLPQISTVALVPDHLYLKLIEGINNDTIVSCMVAPNHLFLQQPTHPSFPNLNMLNSYMNACYSEADSPLLPTPIPENTVCAAFSVSSWYRAIILSTDPNNGTSYVKFLDYGGYAYVENSKLRQIRGDFMLLPFQAAECFLANIKPVEESGWCEEAYTAVAQMTKGAIIYTQVVDYTEDGIPLVYCYLILGPTQVVFLNQELVNQGHAEWLNCGEEAAGVTVA
ncbi:KH domain-containing protein C56G2.1 [Asbolus verrucosus]|uniref:KH domain-containing protein C56G2.1 n=1 Tax=Asbolus verrucosus TaxID=1661398 RepID=A0A482VRL3_ASBVE|nr:KH domain-containing protein C56G2.1 [Asbolus verrucosus]